MNPNLDKLARAIVTQEKEAHAEAWLAVEAALRKLHDAMVSLVGAAGFAALLRRAIHLAKREHDWLGNLVIASPFSVEQLHEQAAIVGEGRTLDGGAALIATLLGLLCTFIGEPLTLRQVNQVWTNILAVRASSGGTSSGTKESE